MARREVANTGPATALKKFMGLRGSAPLEPMGELVPTLAVGDISEAPYSERRRFAMQLAVTAVAGQRGYAGISNQSTDRTLIIEGWQVGCQFNTNLFVYLVSAPIAGTPQALQSLDTGMELPAAATDPIAVYGTGAIPFPVTRIIHYLPLTAANNTRDQMRIVVRPGHAVAWSVEVVASNSYYNAQGFYDLL